MGIFYNIQIRPCFLFQYITPPIYRKMGPFYQRTVLHQCFITLLTIKENVVHSFPKISTATESKNINKKERYNTTLFYYFVYNIYFCRGDSFSIYIHLILSIAKTKIVCYTTIVLQLMPA